MSIPEEWVVAIRRWARSFPRVQSVHLFGSRAKDSHRPDSDVDIAVILTEDENDTAAGYAIFEGGKMKDALAPLLPVPLDLQFAFDDDQCVMPAVRSHGIELYRATP